MGVGAGVGVGATTVNVADAETVGHEAVTVCEPATAPAGTWKVRLKPPEFTDAVPTAWVRSHDTSTVGTRMVVQANPAPLAVTETPARPEPGRSATDGPGAVAAAACTAARADGSGPHASMNATAAPHTTRNARSPRPTVRSRLSGQRRCDPGSVASPEAEVLGPLSATLCRCAAATPPSTPRTPPELPAINGPDPARHALISAVIPKDARARLCTGNQAQGGSKAKGPRRIDRTL